MALVNELKKSYSNWLNENMSYNEIDSKVIRIDTPFLDNEFDNIVLYVDALKNDEIIITDDGYTLDNLESLGVAINNRSPKKRTFLEEVIKDFGVDFDLQNKELFIKTDISRFAVSKHRLLQAILRINDMSNLKSDNINSLLYESLAKKFDDNNILYTPRFSPSGRGGITFFFDFAIPGGKKKEKLVRTISKPNNLNASKVLAMDASMLKGIRDANYFAILDDVNNSLNRFSEIETIFNENPDVRIQAIRYSDIDEQIKLLTN